MSVYTSTRVSHMKGSTEEDNVNENGCPTLSSRRKAQDRKQQRGGFPVVGEEE